MAETLYGLNRRDRERLERALRWVERQARRSDQHRRRSPMGGGGGGGGVRRGVVQGPTVVSGTYVWVKLLDADGLETGDNVPAYFLFPQGGSDLTGHRPYFASGATIPVFRDLDSKYYVLITLFPVTSCA